jgi:HEAT repeat protein
VRSLDELVRELLSGDDERAEAVADELASRGEFGIQAVLNLLQSVHVDHRWWAARTLAGFSDVRAADGLIELLSDPEPSVRQCAALSLRHNPSPRAIPTLSRLLESVDRILARLAGDALTAVGSQAIPALGKAMKSSMPHVRIEAARALSKMQREETITILFEGIDDPSSMVRHWVEEGVTTLGVGMVFFDA